METKNVDVAIIGAGTAGLNARREAEKAGKDWVLIESGPYGTTCARVGCMPSKLLIAAADSAHGIKRAETFGIDISSDGWDVDGEAVMDRVQRERDRFVGFVVDSTESLPEDKRLRGHAQFEDDQTLIVDDSLRVQTEATVIATGSSPWIPPSLSTVEDDVLTSDEIFELNDLPDSLAVIGTGIIGLELGQAMDRLGVDTSFFNPFYDVGLVTDPDVHDEAADIFGEKLEMYLDCEMHSIETKGEGFNLSWHDAEGKTHSKQFDEVLAAAGRRPNIQRLGLENTALSLDENGIPEVDSRTMQCGESSIFIAGDAAGHRNLLHEASDEGRIAGANAAHHPEVEATVRRTSITIGFTEPQMASVGPSFAELENEDILIGEVSYNNQGRARVMDIDEGLVRFYADKTTCKFLGAEMIGPRMENMAHLLAWAAQKEMRVQEMLSMPFYHPVLEEGLRTGLRDLAEKLKVKGQCPPEDFGISPGS